MELKRKIVLFAFLFLLVTPLVLSQTEGTATEEYITYDEFQEQPSLENYEQLSPEDQMLYYSDPNNVGEYPEIDVYYFSNPTNVGQNPQADEQFFTGAYSDDAATASRENFQSYPESAGTYVEKTYSLSYEVSFEEALAADFVYDSATGTLTNNGKTITLSQFSADAEVQEIKTTPTGFAIIRKEAEIAIAGDGASNVAYDAETNQLIMQDATGAGPHSFSIQAEGDLNLDINKDGSLTIEGKASGDAIIDGQAVMFNNHIGTLILNANGDIDAENAEVITPFLYGEGNFKKEGNTITAQDHGNTKETYGNIHDSHTIIVDRTTKVGVQTQGQTGADTVTIHLDQSLDKFPDFSKFKDTPAPSEMSVEEARTEARRVQPASYDLGDSAEVWIAREPKTDEVLVTAKGKVDVGMYKVNDVGASARLDAEPHFTGKNGIAEFELRTGGATTDINVRGAAEYTDAQYSKIATDQNGATFRIERSVASTDDAIVFDCYQCDVGKAIQIDKSITIATKAVEGYDLYQQVSTEALSFSVDVAEDGTLVYQPQTTDLGTLAALQTEGATVVAGRGIAMKTYCSQETECNFALNTNKEGSLQLVSETLDVSDPANPVVTDTRLIDMGVHAYTGEKIVIASEEEIDSAKYALEQIDAGNIRALAESGIVIENEEIRDLILQETTIDVTQLDNDAYVQQLETAAAETQQFKEYRQQLLNDYGIEIDSRGNCVSDAQTCAKIDTAYQKQYNLAWVWSRAQMQALTAESATVEAQAEVGLVSEADAAEAVRENKKTISNLEQARTQMNTIVVEKQRVEAVKAGTVSDQAKRDMNTAARFSDEKEQLVARDQQLDQSIAYFQNEINSDGITDSKKERYKRQVQLLEEEKAENRQKVAYYEAKTTLLAAQYAQDRPDIAAHICLAEGTHCAAQYIEATGALDPDTAYSLAVGAALHDGDVATAAQYQKEITDPVLAQQVDQQIYGYVMEDLEAKKQESEALVTEKRNEILEEYSGVTGFFTYVGRAGSAINLYQLAPGEQESVLETYETADAIALKQLDNQRDSALMTTQLMRGYQAQGYTAAEAMQMMENGISPTGQPLNAQTLGDHYGSFVYAQSTEWYKATEKQVNGQELTKEDAAAVRKEEIQTDITFFEGKVAPVRDDIETFQEEYGDTSQGAWAQSQTDYLAETCGIYFSCGTIETYGDIAVEAVTVIDVLPVGVIMAGLQTASTATKAVVATEKATAYASKGMKVVEAGVGAERIAVVSKKMQPVVDVLTKERFLSSTGRELQFGVELAKTDYQAAQATGDAVKVAEASKQLSDAETAFQGWKTASSTYTNVFLKEIGWTAGSRAALGELNDAVLVYEKVSKAEGASSVLAVEKAAKVTSASKKVQEATVTATMVKRVETMFAGTSDETTVAKAVDVIDESGAILVIDDKGKLTATGVTKGKEADVAVAVEDMNTVLINRGVKPAEAWEEADTVVTRVVREAEDTVVTDSLNAELRGQHVGKGDNVLPVIDSESYADEITEQIIRNKADVNTQYELAEQMPTQKYMEGYVAVQRAEDLEVTEKIVPVKLSDEALQAIREEELLTGKTIDDFLDDPVIADDAVKAGRETAGPKTLDELLESREIALEADDLGNVREIDYQILAREEEPPISAWTDDMFDEDIAAVIRSDGTLQKTEEVDSIEGAFDEAVSGVKSTALDATLEERIAGLEGDPYLFRVYDEAGEIDWRETQELYDEGVRLFRTKDGTQVPVTTDNVVENLFDFCRELKVNCGLAGSDTYRSIRLRKPTNIEKSSDFDIIAPSEAELQRIGYKEAGRDGVSLAQARDVLGEEWSQYGLTGRQIQWAHDLKLNYESKGIQDVAIDLIGADGKLADDILYLPGETSRKLILQSDGLVLGSEQGINDALEGIIRLDREPDRVGNILRPIRFVTEEEGMVLDPATKEAITKYVKKIFSLDPDKNPGYIDSLYSYMHMKKPLGKVFENTLDARKSVELMDEVGLKSELTSRGLDLDGWANLIEDARASGQRVSHEEIYWLMDSRPQVGDMPFTIADEAEYLTKLTGERVSEDVAVEVVGPGFSRDYNSKSLKDKFRVHQKYKQVAEEITTPIGELKITPDTVIEPTLYRLNMIDDEGKVYPQYTHTRLIDVLASEDEVLAAK